ncbi:hypothetical protein BD414DRAFT_571844 [Trametes punicea]|nr:hypothetical protein BD414DRAFT_571844 [Trametes punicea]
MHLSFSFSFSSVLISIILAISSLPEALTIGDSQDIIVDDTTGSGDGSLQIVQYSPPGVWKAGQNCTRCEVSGIDKSKVLNGTWHEAVYNITDQQVITGTLVFMGSGVYAYGIVSHSNTSPTGNTYMSFILDDQDVGAFVRTRNESTTIEYDVPLFWQYGLSSGKHNFTIVVRSPQFANSSIGLLDATALRI